MTALLPSTDDLAAYEAELADQLELSAEAQDLLFRSGRTANAFTDEPVSDAQLEAVYDLMKWGPTAFNAQPLRIVAVRSPQARERLAQHLGGFNKTKTLAAPLTVILAADAGFHDLFGQTMPANPGVRDLFADNATARRSTADLNAALQAAYFLIAVRAAGLAAGPMTGYDAAGVNREFFGEDSEQKAVMVVNIGRPAPDAYRPRQPRLDAAQVISAV